MIVFSDDRTVPLSDHSMMSIKTKMEGIINLIPKVLTIVTDTITQNNKV